MPKVVAFTVCIESIAYVGIGFAKLCRDMKINVIPTSKFALLCTLLAGALLTFSPSARAVALQIGDTHELGFVNYGIPAGDQDRLNYVNHLIGMALGGSDKADGQTYFRSKNAFSQLPQAVLAGSLQGKTTTINLGAGGLYTYLVAKYDGQNYGTEVWYVGDLSGTITIPAAAGRYDLSGWMLFRSGVPTVPDGGTTAMLLGAALSVLGIARRYMMS
jgi:VPDSG-CTERM motif